MRYEVSLHMHTVWLMPSKACVISAGCHGWHGWYCSYRHNSYLTAATSQQLPHSSYLTAAIVLSSQYSVDICMSTNATQSYCTVQVQQVVLRNNSFVAILSSIDKSEYSPTTFVRSTLYALAGPYSNRVTP